MSDYEVGIKLLEETFGKNKDNLIALATIARDPGAEAAPRPVVRTVDAYYEDGVFYVTTNLKSHKMQQILKNPEVSIASCSEMFTASGTGHNLGWVLDPKNADLRSKLRAVFSWYDSANDEKDENCCILAIRLTKGTLNVNHWEKLYHMDFQNKKIMESR